MLAHASLPGMCAQSYVVRSGVVRRVPRAALCGTQRPMPLGAVKNESGFARVPYQWDVDWIVLAEALSPVLYLECAGLVLPPAVTIGALALWLYTEGAGGARLRDHEPGNNVFGILARWSEEPAAWAERVESALAGMRYGITGGDMRLGVARIDLGMYLLLRATRPTCGRTYCREIALAAARMPDNGEWILSALPVDTVASHLTA